MEKILTDDQAAAIWSGDTSSLLNFSDSNEPVEPLKTEENEDTPPVIISDEEITKALHQAVEEDEDEDDEPIENLADDTKPELKTDEKRPKGRKPSDLISLVNELVEKEELFGFEEGEVKTIEEAKELIKLNLKEKEKVSSEKWWEEKTKSYSPQIQAILHYAENGGQDVSTLINAISKVEETVSLDLEDESGQEEIVRQVLKLKGFDDEEIKDQIETLKDLDKLKAKAEKFFPDLEKMREEQVSMILQEEELRNKQAKEASRNYINTIKTTLDKDNVGILKLEKDDKAKIFESLALANFTSLSGNRTNAFVKTLEELQFGKNANYEHFLNIVHFAVDKDGFLDKLKNSLKNELTETTVKKLKTAKTSTPTSDEDSYTAPVKKNVIARDTFKNPYK